MRILEEKEKMAGSLERARSISIKLRPWYSPKRPEAGAVARHNSGLASAFPAKSWLSLLFGSLACLFCLRAEERYLAVGPWILGHLPLVARRTIDLQRSVLTLRRHCTRNKYPDTQRYRITRLGTAAFDATSNQLYVFWCTG